MLSTSLSYGIVSRDMKSSLARVAKDPAVKREIDEFMKRIEGIKSIDAFLDDERVYRFGMKAFGLEDMIYAKGFMRKVLEGGIDKRDSFANSLTDKRYREFVEAFNFARFKGATTIFDDAKKGVVDRYIRQTLEQREGASNEGVRLALYFERRAKTLKSPFQILADPALSAVVRTALGLPDQIAATNVDKQAALIESRINLKDFQDPKKLATFLQRFTAMHDAKQPNPATQALTSLAAPIAPMVPGKRGIPSELLLGLQTKR